MNLFKNTNVTTTNKPTIDSFLKQNNYKEAQRCYITASKG